MMKKSIVGDPLLWPGLVYAPINIYGLLYALGTVSGSIGLLFEEFSQTDNFAVCRQKTDNGWVRVKAALALRSSEYAPGEEEADLLICWSDDTGGINGLPVLELSGVAGNNPSKSAATAIDVRGLDSIFAEDPSEDLLVRGESRIKFEDTIRQLDERIKKIRSRQ